MMRVTIVSLCIASFIACYLADQNKQVKTVVYMQSIAVRLQNRIDLMKQLPVNDATALITEVNRGLDAWHHPFAYYSNGGSYVLVSSGSDGRFESDEAGYYFSMVPHDIHNDPRRDIVLRDGVFVARAGK